MACHFFKGTVLSIDLYFLCFVDAVVWVDLDNCKHMQSEGRMTIKNHAQHTPCHSLGCLLFSVSALASCSVICGRMQFDVCVALL